MVRSLNRTISFDTTPGRTPINPLTGAVSPPNAAGSIVSPLGPQPQPPPVEVSAVDLTVPLEQTHAPTLPRNRNKRIRLDSTLSDQGRAFDSSRSWDLFPTETQSHIAEFAGWQVRGLNRSLTQWGNSNQKCIVVGRASELAFAIRTFKPGGLHRLKACRADLRDEHLSTLAGIEIHELDLSENQIGATGVLELCKVKSLHKLNLSHNAIKEGVLPQLFDQNSALVDLNISYNAHIEDVITQPLACLPSLTTLDITGTQMGGDEVRLILHNNPQISVLSASASSFDEDDRDWLGHAKLQELRITGCGYDYHPLLENIGFILTLKSLHLDGVHFETEDLISMLARNPSLQRLSLWDTNVNCDGAVAIAHCGLLEPTAQHPAHSPTTYRHNCRALCDYVRDYHQPRGGRPSPEIWAKEGSIESLTISGGTISDRGRSALRANRRIQHLELTSD